MPDKSFQADGVAFQVVDVADHRIRKLVLDLQGAERVSTAS
jgi:hypothetical protein